MKGGTHNLPQNRYTTTDWYNRMSDYLNRQLDILINNDNLSNSLFPDRYKKIEGHTYKECIECKREIDIDMLRNGVCQECLSPEYGDEYKCDTCDELVFFTNYDKYILKRQKSKYCKKCAEESFTIGTCINSDCRKDFVISKGEKEFFDSKGFDLPKRCKECREKQKEENNKFDDYLSSEYISSEYTGFHGEAEDEFIGENILEGDDLSNDLNNNSLISEKTISGLSSLFNKIMGK